MLCPDIWNYPVPENTIAYNGGDLNNKSLKNLNKLISKHYFNEIFSIVLPGEYDLPGAVSDLIKDSDHYKVHNFQLKELLSRQFIEGFVRRGKFTALSCNVRHEIDDCFAVSPDGLLILSVSREVYQSLGVEGHPIQNSRRHKDKYIISVNLMDHSLRPGTKHHERIQRALSHELLPEIALFFTWDPPDSSICPSSVAKYFTDIGYQVDLYQTKVNHHQEYDLLFPKVDPLKLKSDGAPHELVEAVAMCMLSCDFESELSSYEPSEPVEKIKTASVVHCKGLFSTDFLLKLIETLRSSCESKKMFPWVSLFIRGFENSPLTFSKREHVFSCNGDNDKIKSSRVLLCTLSRVEQEQHKRTVRNNDFCLEMVVGLRTVKCVFIEGGSLIVKMNEENKRKRRTWDYAETKALLSCYLARKDEFQSFRKKRIAYQNIVEDLTALNVLKSPVTAILIENKIYALLRAYKTAVDNNHKTENSPCLEQFHEEMEEIFGTGVCAPSDLPHVAHAGTSFEHECNMIVTQTSSSSSSEVQSSPRLERRKNRKTLKERMFEKKLDLMKQKVQNKMKKWEEQKEFFRLKERMFEKKLDLMKQKEQNKIKKWEEQKEFFRLKERMFEKKLDLMKQKEQNKMKRWEEKKEFSKKLHGEKKRKKTIA